MPLSDILNEASQSAGHVECCIGVLERQLAGDDLAGLYVMLYGDPSGNTGGRGWSAAKVFARLTQEGYRASYQQVNHHRSKPRRCGCDAR
jgi:hypothetical protein